LSAPDAASSFHQNALSLHPATVGFRLAWPELAELAARSGYQGAVIAKQQPLPVEATSAVRASSIQLPVEVRQDETAFLNTLPRLPAVCRFAASVGCRIATLGVPPSSEQPRDAQAVVYHERLKRCCDVLDQYSIRLALECITPVRARRAHPYEFIRRNEEMLDFALTVSPTSGLVIDSWHWHHAGSDPQWIRNIPPDRILDAHISDSPDAPPEAIRDLERLLPGEGIVDFKSFFALLDEKNYPGPYTVEVFGRGLRDLDPSDAARRAFDASAATLRNARRSGLLEGNATAPDSAEA
jgi:sugar phosphate isomerase/epimerase